MSVDARRVRIGLLVGFAASIPLAVALDAAGDDVSLAVWIAAMAVFVGTYVRIAVLIVLAWRVAHPGQTIEESPRAQRAQRAMGTLIWVMPGYIFIALAANVSDPVRLVLAYVPVIVCTVAMHWLVVVGAILQDRQRRREGGSARRTRPRTTPPGGPPW